MITIYQLKPAFQNLLRPILKFLAARNVSPNQITLCAILLSFSGGVSLYLALEWPGLFLLFPVILLLRMGLNALDGMMAREYQQSSAMGEILNELGDVVSDTALYLPFVFVVQSDIVAVSLICLFVALGILCEFSGVLAKAMVQERRYDGPMGKSDRAFSMGLFAIVLYFWPPVALWATPVFILLNGLLLVSCFNRARAILRQAKMTS